MSQSPESDRGTYLPTGWRVVGRGAAEIAERATAYAAAHLPPGDPANTLYAVQCTVPPVVRGRPTAERVLDALTEQIRHTWPDCPRLLREGEVERAPSRYGGLRYVSRWQPGKQWLGEVVWRSVHPVVAGAPITTWVLLEERATFLRLNVRVTADDGPQSVRGYVGAGQAQPSFLASLRPDMPVTWTGCPLAPHPVPPGQVDDFVRSILASPTRDYPAAVVSPLENGEFVVDPLDFSWDLLGRARLYVIHEHRETFALSDAVGDRRMSCYWGAVRCYMPGWAKYDDPLDHPLLIADRLVDPVMRATWLGELGVWLGTRIQLPSGIDEPRVAAESPRVQAAVETGSAVAPSTASGAAATNRATAAQESATDVTLPVQPPAPDNAALFGTVLEEMRRLSVQISRMTDEMEQLRTVSAVRSSSANAMERRLGRIEDILEQVLRADQSAELAASAATEIPAIDAPADAREDEDRPTLVQVVRDAAELHTDALVFLDTCFSSAADSPYEDPERVRAVLDAMARVARRRRDGVLGTSLRDAFSDLGIDYRAAIARSTPARLREQYRFRNGNGELVEAEEHIVLGNTYDPRRCLRIYFSSRVLTEPRFVIAHVGRHFDVMSTT